jgi:hypothetical protein
MLRTVITILVTPMCHVGGVVLLCPGHDTHSERERGKVQATLWRLYSVGGTKLNLPRITEHRNLH